ncbi:hypothetical protein B484DRAFT_425887 [Ochromonadaceae sp. CCMP2298]|nr:hypothetical protein B484DRAFT_425887 [Ochromonadaceae sp. CCMP2298]
MLSASSFHVRFDRAKQGVLELKTALRDYLDQESQDRQEALLIDNATHTLLILEQVQQMGETVDGIAHSADAIRGGVEGLGVGMQHIDKGIEGVAQGLGEVGSRMDTQLSEIKALLTSRNTSNFLTLKDDSAAERVRVREGRDSVLGQWSSHPVVKARECPCCFDQLFRAPIAVFLCVFFFVCFSVCVSVSTPVILSS